MGCWGGGAGEGRRPGWGGSAAETVWLLGGTSHVIWWGWSGSGSSGAGVGKRRGRLELG